MTMPTPIGSWKVIWFGSSGPFYYDDGADALDPDLLYDGVAAPPQSAFITDGQVAVASAPTVDSNVLRLVDVGTLVGDVIGAPSSTDNAIVRFDGTDGKVLQNSALLLDDSGNLSKSTNDLKLDCGTNKTLELIQPVWDDLRTPINSSLRVSGKQPTETVYRGGIVYSFSKISDNQIAFNVQLPHKYKLGTDIEFHIHYILPTAGSGGGAENVKWDFTYSWADIGDAIPAKTTVNTTLDMQSKLADTHYLGEIAATIVGSGTGGVSSMLICSLTRDVSVANNYNDVVYMIEVDFHYQINTLGSRQESIK